MQPMLGGDNFQVPLPSTVQQHVAPYPSTPQSKTLKTSLSEQPKKTTAKTKTSQPHSSTLHTQAAIGEGEQVCEQRNVGIHHKTAHGFLS